MTKKKVEIFKMMRVDDVGYRMMMMVVMMVMLG